MEFLNYIKSKFESNKIGSFECSKDRVIDAVIDLSDRVGLLNPATVKKIATKGLKITKKKNGKYLIELTAFKPPVKLYWDDLRDIDDLLQVIDQLASQGRSIGYINKYNLEDDSSVFQLAIA